MVPSHRPVGFADGAALPPVYGWDFLNGCSSPRLGVPGDKVMAGETPANPATPVRKNV
jgi:hypothetical protein